jgi:hypothetical protein
MLYAQMAEKLYNGETAESVAAWAEQELQRMKSENETEAPAATEQSQ